MLIEIVDAVPRHAIHHQESFRVLLLQFANHGRKHDVFQDIAVTRNPVVVFVLNGELVGEHHDDGVVFLASC